MSCNKEVFHYLSHCCRYCNHHVPLICILVLLHAMLSFSAPESEVLLRFKKSLRNTDKIDSWNEAKVEPCKGGKSQWAGVLCYNEYVWGLRLEKMGLTGIINIDCLKELRYLRVVSFKGNDFASTLPEFKQLRGLKALFISDNSFAGEIPGDSFANMNYLKKVHMENNKFVGTIPDSLAELPRLLELRIDGNGFEGMIPDFQIKEDLRVLNVSNNKLEGPIPHSLGNMDATAFQGNGELWGPPLEECSAAQAARRPSMLSIIIISIVLAAALIAILAMIIILMRRNNRRSSSSVEEPQSVGGTDGATSRGSSRRALESSHGLSFIRDDRGRFDLKELLGASADILGSGSFGASYKVGLANGPMLVVKRFKKLNNMGREEFGEHMWKLGRLTHPNILPLVAFYYRREEKLLITDFCERGSLAICLHGQQDVGEACLNWPKRLNIVKGVAKGLEYLCNELPNLVTPHGHLKSSNVLINQAYQPLLSDYGLIPVVNQEAAQEVMVAYKSPEYAKHGRVTKKTDVWGLGILIIEVLTGRFPTDFLHKGKSEWENDLVAWTKLKFNGEWSEEVIDKEMRAGKNNEGEILKLLRLGIACCGDADERPNIKEARDRIEEIKEVDGNDHS